MRGAKPSATRKPRPAELDRPKPPSSIPRPSAPAKAGQSEGEKRGGSFVEVPGSVAVIHGSSLINCRAELKHSIKRYV
jgi:hypothetical protein